MKYVLGLCLCLSTVCGFSQDPKTSLEIANHFAHLGDSLIDQRIQFDSAIYYYDRASELFKELGQPTEYYTCQNRKVEAMYYQGEYVMAQSYCQSIIDELSENEMVSDLILAQAYQRQGMINFAMGNYQKTIDHEKRSLGIRVKKLGNNDIKISDNYNLLGLAESRLGNYANSLEYFNKDVDLIQKTYGEGHRFLASSYNNMAIVYFYQGNYTLALEHYFKSLEIKKAVFGEEDVRLASNYNNIGIVYEGQWKLQEAIDYYLRALEIKKKSYPASHPKLASSYTNLGAAYHLMGDFEDALKYYELSLPIKLEKYGKDHPDMMYTYYGIGMSLQGLGRKEEASEYFNKGFEVGENTLGPNHPDRNKYLAYRGSFFEYLDSSVKAAEQYLAVNSYLLKYTKQSFDRMGESEREQFYNMVKDYYEVFQNFAVRHPEYSEELFNLRMSTKSILLSASNKIRRSILESGDRALIDLYDEVQLLKQQVGEYDKLTVEELKASKQVRDSLADQLLLKDQMLAENSSYYAEDIKAYTWQDVQGKLQKGEAAVEIIRLRKYSFQKLNFEDSVIYAALIITPKTKDNPEVVLLPKGSELETKYIKGYRNLIANKSKDIHSYNQFWQPIISRLKGVKTIYFSPDGVYNLINLSTLFNPVKKQYIFDEVKIHQLTSMRDLMIESKEPMKNNLAILMGNPDFGSPANGISERAFMLSDFINGEISPLPGTAAEIDDIKTMFADASWRQKIWVEDEANEINLKKMLKPKVLHIATHGFFQEDVDKVSRQSNPLFRSGLLFTGSAESLANASVVENDEDGILTAFEAMNLNIDNTELVVLSACETGLGDVKNGEGVYGLQRAFKVAGAKTIVTSLWKVSDEVTKKLMVTFYSYWLNGQDKHTAFHLAQTSIKEEHPEPYYWGAFVMVGN